MKKVAVLIPSYKPKEYLERCLSSLENQTLSKNRFCVYIALNGPKDSYELYILNILKSMNFIYQYIYIEVAGVSNARNKLIDISTEEFITFVDDDDMISENYLENLLNISTKKIIGISNIYNFKNNRQNLNENYIGKSFKKLATLETSKFRMRKYFSSPCAKIIHRNIIGKTRFDENLKKGEDSIFMTMISKNIYAIQKATSNTLYLVYERENSVSRQKIKLLEECKISAYLIKIYLGLLLTNEYDKIFLLTRIAAALKKPFRIGLI